MTAHSILTNLIMLSRRHRRRVEARTMSKPLRQARGLGYRASTRPLRGRLSMMKAAVDVATGARTLDQP